MENESINWPELLGPKPFQIDDNSYTPSVSLRREKIERTVPTYSVLENCVTALELYDRNITEVPWLWENYIPRKELCCLAGPSDSCKSTLQRQLACALARRDKEFLGFALNPIHGKVLYVVSEDSENAVSMMVRRQNTSRAANLINVHYCFTATPQNILNTLKMCFDKHSYDLVVIDVWMDFFLGNPNSVADIRTGLFPFAEFAKSRDASILMTHHINKAASSNEPHKNSLSGSQGFESRMRSVVDLRAKDDKYQLTIVKGNYCPTDLKNRPWMLKLNPTTRILQATGKYGHFEGLEGKSKFKDPKMLEEIELLTSKGFSASKIYEHLTITYKDSKVPGMTSIKQLMKISRTNKISGDQLAPPAKNPL